MKKTPGPLAPPDRRRPSLNITVLSYSWRYPSENLSKTQYWFIYQQAYLDHLDHQAQGEGQGHDDEQHREDGQKMSTDARTLFTRFKKSHIKISTIKLDYFFIEILQYLQVCAQNHHFPWSRIILLVSETNKKYRAIIVKPVDVFVCHNLIICDMEWPEIKISCAP